MKAKETKKVSTKKSVKYTVTPYYQFWQGVFNMSKEFKSKKSASKYADELINEGIKLININIDYFLGTNMVKYECVSYDGKKTEIYDSFGNI